MEGLGRILDRLFELLVFALGLSHRFWFKLFGVTVQAYENAPSGKKGTSGDQDAGRKYQLR